MTRTVQRILFGGFIAVLFFSALVLGFDVGQFVIGKLRMTLTGLLQGQYTAAVLCLLAAGGFGGAVYAFQDWLTDGDILHKDSTFVVALTGLWAYPGVVCATLLTYYDGVPSLLGNGAAGMVVATTTIVSGMLFVFLTLGLLVLVASISREPHVVG